MNAKYRDAVRERNIALKEARALRAKLERMEAHLPSASATTDRGMGAIAMLTDHHMWCRTQNGHGACDCAWLNQGTERSTHEFVIHRGGFALKDYKVPSKAPRGFWHGDNPLDGIKWAWCPVVDGVVMTSQARGGFATSDAAIKDALASLPREAA